MPPLHFLSVSTRLRPVRENTWNRFSNRDGVEFPERCVWREKALRRDAPRGNALRGIASLRIGTQSYFCPPPRYFLDATRIHWYSCMQRMKLRHSNLWSDCDLYVVGQDGVLREVKW